MSYKGEILWPVLVDYPESKFGGFLAVTDFKAGVLDINFGVDYGLTPGSDRFVVKSIIGYAFPVPGRNNGLSERAPIGAMNPMAHASLRSFQPGAE